MRRNNPKLNNPQVNLTTATNLDLLLAEDHARFLGLPLLRGSRPQVEVAMVVRFERALHFDAGGEVELALALMEALETITSAAWWISIRGLSVSEFASTVSEEKAQE